MKAELSRHILDYLIHRDLVIIICNHYFHLFLSLNIFRHVTKQRYTVSCRLSFVWRVVQTRKEPAPNFPEVNGCSSWNNGRTAIWLLVLAEVLKLKRDEVNFMTKSNHANDVRAWVRAWWEVRVWRGKYQRKFSMTRHRAKSYLEFCHWNDGN